MSAKNEVPAHFGPPVERQELRLFGRWTLWVKYIWRRERSIADDFAEMAPAMRAAITGEPIPLKVDLPSEVKP